MSNIDVMANYIKVHLHEGLVSKKGRILDDVSIVDPKRSIGTMAVPRKVRTG